jgi:hypothetical protein
MYYESQDKYWNSEWPKDLQKKEVTGCAVVSLRQSEKQREID